jgi:hypothetical protein
MRLKSRIQVDSALEASMICSLYKLIEMIGCRIEGIKSFEAISSTSENGRQKYQYGAGSTGLATLNYRTNIAFNFKTSSQQQQYLSALTTTSHTIMASLTETLVPFATYNSLPYIRDVANAPEDHANDLKDLRQLFDKHKVPKDVSIRLIPSTSTLRTEKS